MNTRRLLFALPFVLLLAACGQATRVPTLAPPTQTVAPGLPNPASVFCEEQGGTLEIREDDQGQYGVCVFADGSECEEWAFYRGECQPGGSPENTAAPATAEPTTEEQSQGADVDISNWLQFENSDYGFGFRYPSGWTLEEDLRPQSTAFHHVYWLKPEAGSKEVLTIGFRRVDEVNVGIQRTGVGSGDLVTQGTVSFLGEPLERVVLISEEKTMGVLYNGGAEIARGDIHFTVSLDYAGDWTDPVALTEDVQAVADAVVSSFTVR